MSRKIVAIGGGENGRTKSNGIVLPYETDLIDQEIVRLTEKKNPHFLFLAHAAYKDGVEESYFKVMKKIYGDMYNCECRNLTKSVLKVDFEKAKDYVEWADIIYEGGGDTVSMIELWKETHFDELLKNAWNGGKVMCGVSAGAISWFTLGNTSHPDFKDLIPNKIDGLGFLDAYFSPHSQLEWKDECIKESLKYINKVGLILSNCTAIEIIDDKYRVIKTKSLLEDIEPFVFK